MNTIQNAIYQRLSQQLNGLPSTARYEELSTEVGKLPAYSDPLQDLMDDITAAWAAVSAHMADIAQVVIPHITEVATVTATVVQDFVFRWQEIMGELDD